MVRKALKAAAAHFGSAQEPSAPVVKKRHLVIIRLSDGDWVLQVDRPTHVRGHHYKQETKSLLQGFFGTPSPSKHCAKTKADDIFFEALNFRRSTDLEARAHFKECDQNGEPIEWHPVVAHLEYLSSVIFDEPRSKGRLEEMSLTLLDDHKFAQRLRKIAPAR